MLLVGPGRLNHGANAKLLQTDLRWGEISASQLRSNGGEPPSPMTERGWG